MAGERFLGSVNMVDATGASMGEVVMKRDRPDVYHPPSNASAEDLQAEQEMTAKYYRSDGVHPDCSPVADHGE